LIPFDSYCEPFYEKLGLDYRSTYAFGQIFWTHTYYPHENLEFWRPQFDPADKTRTTAKTFVIETAPTDPFRRSLPLAKPDLGIREEFLVIRAKRRPVVLLQPESYVLRGLNKGPGRIKLNRHLCTVALAFGLSNAKGDTRCDLGLLERIRILEFPQLMFLPKNPGVSDMDGLLKLDELQSVFTNNLEASQYRLADEAVEVLRWQLRLLLTGSTSSEYDELREFLKDTI